MYEHNRQNRTKYIEATVEMIVHEREVDVADEEQ